MNRTSWFFRFKRILPQGYFTIPRHACQGRLQKKENRSRFLKGNRRIRYAPRALHGGGNALHLCSRFFSENVPGFQKKFFDFSKFFRSAPPRPPRTRSSAALVQAPSLYKYVFFVKNQRVSRNFFDFFKFFSERPDRCFCPRRSALSKPQAKNVRILKSDPLSDLILRRCQVK